MPEPAPILEQDTPQEQQAHAHRQCGPTMPAPPKRERDRHKTVTVILSFLMLLVLALQTYTLFLALGMSRTDQRAWVGTVPPVGTVAPGSALTATIGLRNFGQTPALGLRHDVHLRTQPEGEPFRPDAPPATEPGSCGVLQPGQELAAPVAGSVPLTEGEIREINSGSTSVYVFGEVTYDDIFGKHHQTRFAYVAMPSLSTWRVLDTHNDAD